jgi:UDP-N-acetylglucosamine acyltransferase
VIKQDVLPYSTTASAHEAHVYGANRIGLERRGFSPDAVEPLQNTFRLLTRAGLNTSQAVAKIQEEVPATEEVQQVLEFIRTSKRGFIK